MMMCRPIATLVALLLALWTVPAWADGLLYQLPEDGSWVLFDADIVMTSGDQRVDTTGQLRMSSVGTIVEDELKCRWMEFKLTMKANDAEHVIVAKLLIPENELQEGQKPIEHRRRGWVRLRRDREVEELTEKNLGPIPAFLADPLTDVQPLEATIVAGKLGELSCRGLTGHTEFREGNNNNKVAFRTRRHEKAPFGVVTSQMKFEVERGGEIRNSLEMDLKIHDFGDGAKSELPDHH